jgi:DNA-directed RNA polymerase specialized sigma24 family protein
MPRHRVQTCELEVVGRTVVLQDVCVKAYRSPSSFRGEASLSTWLFRITCTTCMDRLRKRPDRQPLPVEAAQDTPSDESFVLRSKRLGEVASRSRDPARDACPRAGRR